MSFWYPKRRAYPAPHGKSWIGAKVKLLRDITTSGGRTFRAGVVMKVTESNAGGLHLGCYVRENWCSVTGISKSCVVVLVWGSTKEEE